MTGDATPRRFRLALAAWLLALAGFALWTREPMCREGLWRDEAISVYAAQAPTLSELLRRNRVSDYNPPLFNMALAAYTRLAGSEETAVKRFALALGLLNLAGATLLAFEIGGAVAAAVAAALLVNNPLLIEMSTEARPYSLSSFLCVASLLLAFRIRRNPRAGAGSRALLALTLALLAYSHVAGGVVVGVLFAWGVLDWRRRPALAFGRSLTICAALGGAAFLLWLPTTWRQFRAGLPWEPPLSLSQNFESLLGRSGGVLPIPRAFEEPLVFAGAAALLAVAAWTAPRIAAGLRREGAFLVVPAVAGAAVWLVLGSFSRHARYLIIPATLSAVVFSAVVGQVLAAGWASGRFLRVAAVLGGAALVAVSFSARADLYAARAAGGNHPKSGIRSLCQSRPSGPGELVVVAPDYLAPTVWYYCGRDEAVRGFAHWDHPVLFDPGAYARLWTDPAAADRTSAEIVSALRQTGRSRFTLVRDRPAGGLLALYDGQVGKLEADLARTYDEASRVPFPGRIESVEAVGYRAR